MVAEASNNLELSVYNSTKPTSFEFLDKKISASTWRTLYVDALKLLAEKYPDVFKSHEGKSIVGTSIKIRSDKDISDFSRPFGIIKKFVGGWLFVESDLTAQQVLMNLKSLLAVCNEAPDSFLIIFSGYSPQNAVLNSGNYFHQTIQKSLSEIVHPSLKKETDFTEEEQYVQWLIGKGVKPSEMQAEFSMTEKVINRLRISSRKLFSITNPNEIDHISFSLTHSSQWRLYSPRQQNQILHTLGLYHEFRNSRISTKGNNEIVHQATSPTESNIPSKKSHVQSNHCESTVNVDTNVAIIDLGDRDFTRYNSLKPTFVEYDGERKEKKLWQPLYLEACKYLAKDHLNIFLNHSHLPILGSNPEIVIGSKPLGLRMAGTVTQLSECNFLYIETGYVASDILLRIKRLLDLCNVNYNCLKIGCREQKKAESFSQQKAIKNDPLLTYLKQQNVRFCDYRMKSGCLWIYGKHEHDLDSIVKHCWDDFHVAFTYNSSTRGTPCWWTKDRSPDYLEIQPLSMFSDAYNKKANFWKSVPERITFNGSRTYAQTWKELYVHIVKELYRLYPRKFISIIGDNHHQTGLHIETTYHALSLNERTVLTFNHSGQRLYIETQKTPQEMLKNLYQLIDWCGLPKDTLKFYQSTKNEPVTILEHTPVPTSKKELPMSAVKTSNAEKISKQPVFPLSTSALPNNLSPTSKNLFSSTTPTNILSSNKIQRYTELLQEAFPDGFKDGSAIASKKMLIAYQNKYGEEPSESKSEIFEIVRQVGTLRDGRVYPKTHSQLLSEINDEIIDLLNTGATCVYCDAVFERYRIQLAEEQHIYNAEALREPLVSLSRGRYVTKWGMFCLPDRDADISMDVLFCMRKHPAPTTYDELQDELWYIPLDKIKKALMDDPAMVNVGDRTYFYAPNLPVSKEELHLLSSYMESELGYHSYATTKQLMQLIHEKCPTIEINTEGFSTLAVRNSLSYLLRKEFIFRGNIISLATTQPPVDTKQAFCEFCRERETMTTDELQAFADEVDSVIYWDSVFSEMVRVSEHDWVRKGQIRWTPEAIDAKLDEMCEGDYLIIKDICLFLQFPVVDYRWNSFLLESYVNTYSPNYMLLHTSFSVYDCCGAIVKKTSSIHDYHDLAVDVLAKDTNWNDQQSALQVLVDKGLQQRKKLADIAQVVKEARLKREKRQKEST